MTTTIEQKQIKTCWVVGTTRDNVSKTLAHLKTILEMAGSDITVTVALENGKIPLQMFDNTDGVWYLAKYGCSAIIRDTDVPVVFAADLFETIKVAVAEEEKK